MQTEPLAPQVEDSFAPLDELAQPGAGLDDFDADFTVGFNTIPPGTEQALSDSGLLDTGSLDHMLTDSHDEVSVTETGSERELTEADLDALDFSQLAASTRESRSDSVPPVNTRPPSLGQDQPRATGMQGSLESSPLETPVPFSDLSSGDMEEDDVEYSIDFGLDDEVEEKPVPKVEQIEPPRMPDPTPTPTPAPAADDDAALGPRRPGLD